MGDEEQITAQLEEVGLAEKRKFGVAFSGEFQGHLSSSGLRCRGNDGFFSNFPTSGYLFETIKSSMRQRDLPCQS